VLIEKANESIGGNDLSDKRRFADNGSISQVDIHGSS
jgi:hypothetical protein